MSVNVSHGNRLVPVPVNLSSQAGGQEAAAEDVEAAAAERAGGQTPTGRGGATQTGGRDPQNPRSVQPGRAVQPLHEAGGRQDEDAQQSKRTFIHVDSGGLLQMCVLWRTEVSSVLQSTDREHRKSAGKQNMDASGNLYQYDNYDEVAMDTDSETGSPGEDSPVRSLFCSVRM